MAAVGPQIGDLKLFGMHFNQMILLEHLIRSGNQMEPIHANLRVVRRNPTPYEEAMRNPEGSDPPPIDFYVDDDDMITEPSSGKNFCSFWKSIEGLSSFPPSFLPSFFHCKGTVTRLPPMWPGIRFPVSVSYVD